MRKKICSIILLIVILLNSSLLTIISTAVDEVGNSAKSTSKTQEKASIDLSYTQLTNKVQNEMVITGMLERDTEDDPLYENPIITFEMPSEVEKVVVNDIKVLYDEELKLGEYKVTQNEAGNKIVTILLNGKQTKYQTDGINNGTAIRVSANVILKQDIKTSDTKIVMTCTDGIDKTKIVKSEKTIKVVNASEIPAIEETTDEQEGTKTYANGLLIENKTILGDTILKDDNVVYEGEIIKYEVKITNTTNEDIDNIKVVGKIPNYMTYVELYDNGFWGDTKEYREDETVKEKEIVVGKLKANESEKYYYEVKVGEIDTRSLSNKAIEKYIEMIKDKDTNNLTTEQLHDLRANTLKQAILEIQPDVAEDKMQKIIDEVMAGIDKYGDENLLASNNKREDFSYEQDTNLQTSVLINEEIASTYNINVKIKLSELNLYLIPIVSRVNKNEWLFDLQVENNNYDETLKTIVTVKLPQKFEFESIESRYLQENGENEKVDYEIKDNIITLKYDLEKNKNKLIRITTRAVDEDETENCLYEEIATANAQVNDNVIYKSNQAVVNGGVEAVKITQISDKNGEKLKMYDEITYTFNIQNIGYVREEFGGFTTVNFEDTIPSGLEIIDIQYNDNEVSSKIVDSIEKFELKRVNKKLNAIELNEIKNAENEKGTNVKLNINIKTNETSVVTIKARVKKIEEEKNEVIENSAIVKGENIKTKQSNIITNTIYKTNGKVNIPVTPSNPTESTKPTPDRPTSPTNPTKPINKEYLISGKAWIDENEDGKSENGEQAKTDLQVYLYDITNKKFVTDENEKVKTAKTDKNGKYSFEKVSNGKYYVIVEYDLNEYSITDYKKTGISELTNCDFISKEVIMFNERKKVGITDIINVEQNIENLDIGLIQKKIFDFKMEQYIQKITVVNTKGTKEYTYNNKKLAKVEINSKQFKGSTVAIEYKIVVTNVGEIAGNVNEIIAEIPSKLDFHSELNNKWSKSMTYNLSNTSYRSTEIKPGESIEATLILSKTLDNDSAGTLKNVTKIGISENAKHIEDNNKENDVDSTEVIIGISTGIKETIGIIGGILLGLVIIAIIFVLIKKNPKIFNKKTLFFIMMCIFVSLGSIADAVTITNGGTSGNFTHTDSNGNSYTCIDHGNAQCSAGDTYTLIESNKVASGTIYPQFANQETGEEQGAITLTGSISVTGQSSFVVNLSYTDTTGAPGDIVITVSDYGGTATQTVPAGSGSISIPCSSSLEFVPGATVKAEKKYETTATYWENWEYIYHGEHTASYTYGTPIEESTSESTIKNQTKVWYACVYPVFNNKKIGTGRYEIYSGSGQGQEFSSRSAAEEAWKELNPKEAESNISPAVSEIEETLWYISGWGKNTLQRLKKTERKERPFAVLYAWEDSISFDSGNFPKKLTVNKIDYDTGATLSGCRFSISPTTLGGVSELSGGETIDMVMPGSYTITEISAPYGYEYGVGHSETVSVSGGDTYVTLGPWKNIKMTGNLSLRKEDSVTGQALAGVVFNISGLGTYTTDSNGEINIYDILLDADGSRSFTVTEVYNPYYGYVSGESFTVTVYRQRSDETVEGSGKFGSNTYTKTNTLKYAKLSGYVWEDGRFGKGNERNNLYSDNENDKNDKLLSGVKVILHDPVNNMEHVLWTDENGAYVFGSRQYDGEYSNGKTSNDTDYSKDNILLERANEYWVEFEYNGVKYRNVTLNTEPLKANASRASEEIASGKSNEDSSVRQRFNEKFSTISSDKQIDANGESTGIVIDAKGNINTDKISYSKNGEHQSQINYGKNMTEAKGNKEAYGENIYHITATTKENYNFKEYVDAVRNTTGYTDEIKYINLGLYAREQVDVAIDSDVSRFMLNVNGYQHTYLYGKLVSNEDLNGEPSGLEAKLKALKGKYYERPLHEASISYSATPEGQKENNEVPNLYADITYKIYLQNKSNSLTAKIKELTLDYDSDLYIMSYNYENSKNIVETHDEKEITANKQGSGAVTLKEATIDLEKLEDLKIGAQERNVLEVRFRVYANTIAKILNNPNGIKFDFMAEVKAYSTYADKEENAFSRAEGLYAYASIDKNSAARNSQVEIYDDKEFGPDKFVTDTFENDTTIAPTFILSKGEQTKLSGIVYEDSPLTENVEVKINDENSGKKNTIYKRVGDGKYNNENVMANVLVEVLSVPKNIDGNDSDQARKLENGQQAYEVAKLYQENKTTPGQESNVLARTYTDNNGKYEFKGLVAGDYVIKFTYGKNMKDVNDDGQEKENIKDATTIYDQNGSPLKEIEAREYKSTIIASPDIKKAMNINESDGKAHLNGDYAWFLRDEKIRYSDAVDDVEYRANLEKDGKIDYETLQGTKPYVYDKMEAYTPYFKLGIEEFNDNSSQDEYKKVTLVTNENGTIDYEYTIDNIDFGLIERPIVDLKVDKNITNLKVSLGNGQVLINGDPSKDKLPYVRSGLDDFVPIEMDTEILHNATIEEEYTITITNNSELDYAIYGIWDTDTTEKIAKRRNYYYYGSTTAPTDEAVTTRINVLVDYLGSELVADEESMRDDKWESKALEEIAEYKTKVNGVDITTNLLSSEEISNKLKDGKYSIYTTDTYGDPNADLVTIGKSKSTKYVVSRELATSAGEMTYTNDIEILQYSGYSQNKDRDDSNRYVRKVTTPGNLVPGGTKAREDDEDAVRTTITPPTGTIIARWLYITTAGAGLTLIAATIIFIRKRILG